MESYTPLFSSLTRSSIWDQDDKVRILWVTMLSLANKDGYVGASLSGLAHEARFTVQETEAALKVLMSPDPHSRDKQDDGVRVFPAERGWLIPAIPRFRAKITSTSRVREFRKGRKTGSRETNETHETPETTNATQHNTTRHNSNNPSALCRCGAPADGNSLDDAGHRWYWCRMCQPKLWAKLNGKG